MKRMKKGFSPFVVCDDFDEKRERERGGALHKEKRTLR
jgi:hypothetical protein